MKITVCSFNTERGGREGFHDDIRKMGEVADVIMLQEVHNSHDPEKPAHIMPGNGRANIDEPGIRPHLFDEIQATLNKSGEKFIGLHAPQIDALHDLEAADGVTYGQAIFVHQSLVVTKFSTAMIYGRFGQQNTEAEVGGVIRGNLSAKSGVAATLKLGVRFLTFGTGHGPWSLRGKVDMPERFEVNRGIARMLMQHAAEYGDPTEAEVLFMGDLNYHSGMSVLRNLASEAVFGVDQNGRPGGVILNHEFGITETRTRHYPAWKEVREADFAIASQAIFPYVTDMWADYELASDHAALYVTLDL